MEITYVIIVAIVTYILGSLTKIFFNKIPTKYIPIQNVIIAIVASLICYFTKIEANFIESLVMCFSATMGAGGVYDLLTMLNSEKENSE